MILSTYLHIFYTITFMQLNINQTPTNGADGSSLPQPTAHHEISQEDLVSGPGASQSFQKDLKIEDLWVVSRQEEDSF